MAFVASASEALPRRWGGPIGAIALSREKLPSNVARAPVLRCWPARTEPLFHQLGENSVDVELLAGGAHHLCPCGRHGRLGGTEILPEVGSVRRGNAVPEPAAGIEDRPPEPLLPGSAGGDNLLLLIEDDTLDLGHDALRSRWTWRGFNRTPGIAAGELPSRCFRVPPATTCKDDGACRPQRCDHSADR